MARAIGNTLQHAMFFSQHLRNCSAKCIAVAILLELGIPAKRIGFDYLVYAILSFYDDPAQAITKELYPDVADACGPGVDAKQVESAIRAVIAEAWESRRPKVWGYYFPHYAGKKMERPSNMEFISEIARFLELWQGCCEEIIDEEV